MNAFVFFISCTPPPSESIPKDSQEPPIMVSPIETQEELLYSTAKECGHCHPSHYEEWRQSMHAYATHSPVFIAMANKAFRDTSGDVGKFCTSCHSPLGSLEGEDGSNSRINRSDVAKDSISCEVCHSAVAHKTPLGNLSLLLSTGEEKYGPYENTSQDMHTSQRGEFLLSPELCGSCHDVFNFPSIRIEEAYTEYTSSPALEQNLGCIDCHMSRTPGKPSSKDIEPIAVGTDVVYPEREKSSHRFIGPDYSLLDNFPYPDDAERSQIAQQEMHGQIQTLLGNSMEIAGVERENTQTQTLIHVDLESLVSGHNVPTGFTSERQLWIDISISQGQEIIFQSGQLDSYGDLKDELSWDVQYHNEIEDEQLVNLQSKNIIRHGEVELPDLSQTVFPFDADYILKNSLRPLEIRRFTYSVPLTTFPIQVSISLRYRNLPPYLLRALQLESLVPKLTIFTIDTFEQEL